MTITQRSTTLASAACEGGIRVYSKTADFRIQELVNDVSEAKLGDALKKGDTATVLQNAGWRAGTLPPIVVEWDSALATFAVGSWKQSLFYQAWDEHARETQLREHRFVGGAWAPTAFVQDGVLVGTNIAVVASPDARRVLLVFQDKENWIRCRSATCENWSVDGVKWAAKSVPVVKAASGTGLGLTGWDNLDQIRLYYQGEDNSVYEYAGKFDTGFSGPAPKEALLEYYHPIGDITAVSWKRPGGTEIRLYLQNEKQEIVEWGYNGVTWYGGEFKRKALPNADVIAFVRPVPSKSNFILHVQWAGEDQNLYQAVYPGDFGKWQDPTRLGSVEYMGEYAGSWLGQQFTDAPLNLEEKRIGKVIVRAGDVIDAVRLVFTDGSSTVAHGGGGGAEHVFELAPGEDIVRIRYHADKNFVTRLQFVTSEQRESPEYGRLGAGAPREWTRDGRSALAGFFGCTGKFAGGITVVNGLAPVWASRHSKGLLRLAEDWQGEAQTLHDAIRAIQAQFGQAHKDSAAYRRALEGLRPAGAGAMDAVVRLAESVECLRDLAKAQAAARLRVTTRRAEDIEKLVAVCKAESDVVELKFKDLSARLDAIAPEGTKLNTALAAVTGDLANKIRRLRKLKEKTEWAKNDREKYQKQKTAAREKLADNIKGLKALIEAKDEELKNLPKSVEEMYRQLGPEASSFGQFDAAYDDIPAMRGQLEDFIRNTRAALTLTEAREAGAAKALQELAGVLQAIEAHIADVEQTLPALAAQTAEVQALVDATHGLNSTVADHTALLRAIADASRDVDSGNRAHEFAQRLLPVVQKALSSTYLAPLNGSAPLALEVIQDIANGN